MEKKELLLLVRAYAMSIVARAQSQALAQYLVDDEKKVEYNETVKKNISILIEQEEDEEFRSILKESFESLE